MPYGVDYDRKSLRCPGPEVRCVLLFVSGQEQTASGAPCLGEREEKYLPELQLDAKN